MTLAEIIVKKLFQFVSRDSVILTDFLPLQNSGSPNNWKKISFQVIKDWIQNLDYSYKGIAIPATSPGVQEGKTFYFASTPGTYTNFSGITLAVGEVVALSWNGDYWIKSIIMMQNSSAIWVEADGEYLSSKLASIENDLLAEATARANTDWELEQAVDDTKSRLQDEYAPTYAPPYIISLNLSEDILEVGEVAELSIDSIDIDSRQGGAADDSEGSMKAYIDNVLQEFDPDYSEGSFGPYVLGDVSKNTPGNIAIKLELPYAQGPLLQDTLYNEDYPTGRIPAGTMTRTENLPVSNYAWYGAAESLPAENQIRTVGSGSASNTITIVIGATDTCAFLFVPAGRSIQSIIDTTNLSAPMTYIKQALTTMPAGGAVTYTGEYWALFFSPYGKTVNHVVTLQNS